MFKNFKDKITLSGVTVLMIGVALLIVTFISAYGFLTQILSIIPSGELVGVFGEALAPLIATCIRVMYLGVMGWIGSLLTIRGVTIMSNAPKMEAAVPQKPALPQQKPVPQKAKPEPEPQKESKPEVKPAEPEFVVVPPEQVSQPQPESKEPHKDNSSQQSNSH
jgi:predicted lipid-binding transport protein (Tim44 family)